MNETDRIRMTPRALADLEAVSEYISNDSPDKAAMFLQTLIESIDALAVFPHRYNVPRTGFVRGRQIRSMPVPPYLVRYRIDERPKTVHILRVRHGARRRP